MEDKNNPWYAVSHCYNLVNEEYWKTQKRYDLKGKFPQYTTPRGQYEKPMFCGGALWRKVWSFNETTGTMRLLK